MIPGSRGAVHGAQPVVFRAARLLAIAILIGWSIATILQHLATWSLSDMDAYWNAAIRLRNGSDLYPTVPDPSAVDIYKYAPWFAWVWVPLVSLPKGAVGAAWSVLLVAASLAAVAPLLMPPTLTRVSAAFLLLSLLIWSASSGNVQPLLVAVLVHGVTRRSGPLWIGLTASLKISPAFYALVYLGRRQWLRFALSLLIGALLWAPALLYGLADYQGGVADSPSPLVATNAIVYALVVALAVVLALVGARTRFAWLAAAAGLFASLPRVSLIDLTHLAVGAGVTDGRASRHQIRRPPVFHGALAESQQSGARGGKWPSGHEGEQHG